MKTKLSKSEKKNNNIKCLSFLYTWKKRSHQFGEKSGLPLFRSERRHGWSTVVSDDASQISKAKPEVSIQLEGMVIRFHGQPETI